MDETALIGVTGTARPDRDMTGLTEAEALRRVRTEHDRRSRRHGVLDAVPGMVLVGTAWLRRVRRALARRLLVR